MPAALDDKLRSHRQNGDTIRENCIMLLYYWRISFYLDDIRYQLKTTKMLGKNRTPFLMLYFPKAEQLTSLYQIRPGNTSFQMFLSRLCTLTYELFSQLQERLIFSFDYSLCWTSECLPEQPFRRHVEEVYSSVLKEVFA